MRKWLTVSKTRDLWMIEFVRVHLDEIDDVGTFIEFEAIVSEQHDVKVCHAAVNELCEIFAPILGEPVSASYSDLVEERLAENDESAKEGGE